MYKKFICLLSFVLLLGLASGLSASPYFMIGQDEWADALSEGKVRAMTSSEWDDLMNAWNDPCSIVEGDPPPPADFCSPELYVYYPPCCNEPCYPGAVPYLPESYVYELPRNKLCWIPDFDGDRIVNFVDFNYFASNWLSYSYPTEPGMVMAWNAPPDHNSASGWVFEYGNDPDLRNTTVEIEVLPPSNWSIRSVAFSFWDNSGRSRFWWWGVGSGQPVPWDRRTKLTITTNPGGVSTVTPQPSGSLSQQGFDITQVQYFMASENATRIGVPPPGRTISQPWNMWYNLVVTSLPPPPEPNYFKWRQPARYIGNQGNYWGWDVFSVDNNIPPLSKQICADDWLCTDNRPVTGIRWWGSFPNKYWRQYPGWRDPNSLPPVAPRGFHIGIWTDSPPANIQDMTMISRPNEMIWEDFCYNYTWRFVGFDRRPGASIYSPTDACYRFYCDLDPNFAQDPKVNRVYWLSIAAIYDTNYPDPNYVWGWKTRPHYYQDDAVWITSTSGGEWPPRVGSRWGGGSQIEFPRWYSWDLSFELVTDVNDP